MAWKHAPSLTILLALALAAVPGSHAADEMNPCDGEQDSHCVLFLVRCEDARVVCYLVGWNKGILPLMNCYRYEGSPTKCYNPLL